MVEIVGLVQYNEVDKPQLKMGIHFLKKVLTLTFRYGVCSPCEVTIMKMQIKEFADFTGVSVRTLHYYDEIGLLRPAFVDRATGYRFYDENALLRMQEILF